MFSGTFKFPPTVTESATQYVFAHFTACFAHAVDIIFYIFCEFVDSGIIKLDAVGSLAVIVDNTDTISNCTFFIMKLF